MSTHILENDSARVRDRDPKDTPADKIELAHDERTGAATDAETKETTTDAMLAEHAEQSMTLFESLKVYRSAILWSMAISLVIVMDGYDTGREYTRESSCQSTMC
jgi:hypothetical protein